MNLLAAITLLATFACAWVSAVVYHSNRLAALNRIFTAASSAAAYMLFYFFMCLQAESAGTVYVWLKISSAWYFVIPLFMHFVLVFTEKTDLLKRRFIYVLLYAPALFFCVVNIFTDTFIGEPRRNDFGGYAPYSAPADPSWLWYAMVGWVIILAIIGIVVCVHFYLRQRDRAKKRKAGIVLLSLFIPFFLTMLEELFVIFHVKLEIHSLNAVSLVWLVFWIGFAIWRFDLFKIDPVRAAENVLATMPDFLFIVDRHGVLVSVNSALTAWLGVGEADLLGKPARSLFADGRDGDEVSAELQAAVKVENREVRLRRAHDEPLPVLLSASAISRRGRTIGMVCVGKDIAERKQAERMLLDLNDRLQHSNRELQDFASIASHDLQAPLRKIGMYSERLSEKRAFRPENDNEDDLARIIESVARMRHLIGDLLDYARMTGTGRIMHVDLNRVMTEVVSDLGAHIEKAGAVVECDRLPCVAADYTRMRQLFQNLVGNALKFHQPDRPPRVSVFAANDAGDGLVAVAVRDNGIGIDPRHHDRIFGAFQRLHSMDEFEGSGIGLAVCKKIVAGCGGSIRVESRPGEGATFIVSLPVS